LPFVCLASGARHPLLIGGNECRDSTIGTLDSHTAGSPARLLRYCPAAVTCRRLRASLGLSTQQTDPIKILAHFSLSLSIEATNEAIECAYRERYVGFRNALATVTGDYESARDAVQEAFARALREKKSFRGEGSIEAWIFRIALRAALETRRDAVEYEVVEVPSSALPEPERDPELALALRALPPRRRLVVFLRYFADLSYAEIAEVCEISEGTVAASLAQARDALLEALRPEGVKT